MKIAERQKMNLKNHIDHEDGHFLENLDFLELYTRNSRKDVSIHSCNEIVEFSTDFYKEQIKIVVTENDEIEKYQDKPVHVEFFLKNGLSKL